MSELTLNEYQKGAESTLIVKDPNKCLNYLLMGLGNEAGEVQGKFKKFVRGDYDLDENLKKEVSKELGDVLWYVTLIASQMGYSLEEVAQMNLDKLSKRMSEGKIKGNGDNR